MVDAQTVLDEWKTRPFLWGVNDCARFAHDFFSRVVGIKAMKDWEFPVSNAREFREKYANAGEIYQDRLSSAGFHKISSPTSERPAVAIIHMGQGPPALGVWFRCSLWLVGKRGIEEIEPCTASEFWEPQKIK